MLRKLSVIAAVAGLLTAVAGPALAQHGALPAKDVHWSFEGPLGKFDQAQLQRGYKVYREVCSACHSMNLVSFRNLGDKGGPFYDKKYPNSNDNPYVKAIAKDYEVADIDNETGDAIKRPATPADRFPAPFPNEAAARASNGGALPPDMSLLAKAREEGPAHIYSIITGYAAPPPGLKMDPTQHYNQYMTGDLSSYWSGPKEHVPPGGFIAMAPPIKANQVTFDDGTPATLDQEAKDVSAFLMWAAEPKLEERKQTGFAVLAYLVLFSILLYVSYRKVWKNESH
ncbi:cytochrome c1 [Caulobacter rhizosphaerae]|jgi:ubiquinol-cytochrome c reductase cytochrome c1 subunit|uniref:Cytochrome c1 n=1 Tax=Caulobacter rhizosphaerae TaxID=2010972 RepID=A0ABU1N3V9_9CAUL|nr:cytochrome c1 [Caulobacter rhizosphaerae]MDR6532957.1 ubiquinol-cytochrome c reductase cytochrome c1 subunit [Caulobacter rhizosphaerae]GGL34616.1 ubiquinol cytochrome C oxidoreductase [Caulobacter rhizosphaerae]